jgi:pyruvate/2-oxoglutarate dehydrogenase complex dihydrolipoamide acyltransferase (E2) component
MALALGTENKRQVITASVLAVILLICAFFVYRQFFGSSSPGDTGPAPVAPTSQNPPAASPTASSSTSSTASPAPAPNVGNEAERLNNPGIDPSLHFDKLAESEGIEYSGTGRNIFSAESAPIPIPKPLAPVRPNGAAAAAAQNTPPPPPKPPAIDLKYFGYSQDEHKQLKAFFSHGDDIFMAKTGDIVDHRFKIGVIRPLNVEVTDLAYNNTQTIGISPQ